MIRIILLLVTFIPLAYPQTWTQHTGVKFSTAICPANGASGSVAQDGSSYLYQSRCHNALHAWGAPALLDNGSSVALYIFGGGHSDSGDNSVYKLDLLASTASRVFGPSQITVATYNTNPEALDDGNPNSRHVYQGVVFVDSTCMMIFSGALYSGVGGTRGGTWCFNTGDNTWTAKDPLNCGSGCGTNQGDPYNPMVSVPGSVWQLMVKDCRDERIWTMPGDTSGTLLEYRLSTNQYIARKRNAGGLTSRRTMVMDCSRNRLVLFGGGAANTISVADGSNYNFVSITGSIDSSCSTPLNYTPNFGESAPGFAYITTGTMADKFALWTPEEPNRVYTMDPATYVCTPYDVSGGPTGDTSLIHGCWTCLTWSPTLNALVVLSGFNRDAYTFSFGSPSASSSISGVSSIGGTATIH